MIAFAIAVVVFVVVIFVMIAISMSAGISATSVLFIRRRVGKRGADDDIGNGGSGIAGRVGGGVCDGVDAAIAAAGAFRTQEERTDISSERNRAATDGLDVIGLIAVARSVVRLVADNRIEADCHVR